MAGCRPWSIGISCAPKDPDCRRVVETCQRFKVRGHMNCHVPSSVLRIAFGCAIGTAAVTGLPAMSEPAFAQEAPVAPMAAGSGWRRVAPPGHSGPQAASAAGCPRQSATRTPPASTAQPADPRRPLTVPPNPGLIARPVGPGGRPIPPPPALEPRRAAGSRHRPGSGAADRPPQCSAARRRPARHSRHTARPAGRAAGDRRRARPAG